MSKEIWKYINGFDNYKISNKGRVKSYNYCYGNNEDGVIYLKINPHHKGYVDVKLFKKNKLYNKKIHRLVAIAFIRNPKNKPCVNHKNSIKSDNRVENLEWVTHSENRIHYFKQLKKYQS